eukprot:10689083-Alexandrium_andersonii.AAC.1
MHVPHGCRTTGGLHGPEQPCARRPLWTKLASRPRIQPEEAAAPARPTGPSGPHIRSPPEAIHSPRRLSAE